MEFKNTLFCIAVLLLFTCDNEEKAHLVEIVYDDSYKDVWVNKTEFPEAQDYIRNLDYTLLENPDAHPVHKELLDVFRDVVDGISYEEVIPKTQEILSRRDIPILIQIYSELIKELLVENGKYEIAYENFPQKDNQSDFNYAYKDLPETSLSSIGSDINPLKDLKKMISGQLEIQCKANETIEFAMFDTGADLTTVSRSFARKAGFFVDENKKIEVSTVTSINIYANPGYIQELQVGSTVLKNHHVLVFDDKDVTFQDEDNYLKVDFILGWNAIRHLAVVLNSSDNIYQAEISVPKQVNIKNMFWCGYPGVKVNSENGQSLIFGLDTGSSETELKTNIKQKIDFEIPLVKDTLLVSGVGGDEEYVLEFAKDIPLHLASYKITFKELPIRENASLFFINEDGTIGSEIFQNNTVTIDYKNGIFEMQQDK